MYFPNIRKPATITGKEEGTIEKSGWQKRTQEWCEMKVGKTVRRNDRVLIHSVHPTSKYTDVKSIQRPLLGSEGTSNCRVVSEFTLHQTAQLTVLTRLRPEPETSTPKSNHVLKVSSCVFFVVLGQSSGTSIWVSQVILNYLNAHLLGINTQPSLFWTNCTLIRGKPSPQN